MFCLRITKLFAGLLALFDMKAGFPRRFRADPLTYLCCYSSAGFPFGTCLKSKFFRRCFSSRIAARGFHEWGIFQELPIISLHIKATEAIQRLATACRFDPSLRAVERRINWENGAAFVRLFLLKAVTDAFKTRNFLNSPHL